MVRPAARQRRPTAVPRPRVRTAARVRPRPPRRPPILSRSDRAAFLATPDPVGLYVEPTGSSVPRRWSVPGGARRRAGCGWATLLALGLTMAGLGLADSLGAAIALLVYSGAALLVIGIALVLATWWGRARGLLPLGVLLTRRRAGRSRCRAGTVGRTAESPGQPRRLHQSGRLPADGDSPTSAR